MRITTFVSLLALCSAVPAQWKVLDGKEAPLITAKDWLNADGQVSNEALQGKVWLLKFFATW